MNIIAGSVYEHHILIFHFSLPGINQSPLNLLHITMSGQKDTNPTYKRIIPNNFIHLQTTSTEHLICPVSLKAANSFSSLKPV